MQILVGWRQQPTIHMLLHALRTMTRKGKKILKFAALYSGPSAGSEAIIFRSLCWIGGCYIQVPLLDRRLLYSGPSAGSEATEGRIISPEEIKLLLLFA